MVRKGSLLYKAIAASGVLLIRTFELAIEKTRGNRTFYDPGEFPWIPGIEKDVSVIQRELRALLRTEEHIPEFQDISEEQRRITRGIWQTYIFYAYGVKVEANCRDCPDTAAVLQRIPGMTTGMFSILAPGAHLTPHRGPFKGVMRYHLGIIVPDEMACGIRVGSDVRHWREGSSLVFDDTHDHEAWNKSDQIRAVLFVDFIRDLPFPLSVLNRGMIRLIGASPFVQNMVTKLNEMTNRVSDVK